MDYLTRLIERTARAAPAVQPLLRPRYAPEDGDTLRLEEIAEEVAAEIPFAPPETILTQAPQTRPIDRPLRVHPVASVEDAGVVEATVERAKESPQAAAVLSVEPLPADPELQRPPAPVQKSPPPAGRRDDIPTAASFSPDAMDADERAFARERPEPGDELLMPGVPVDEPAFADSQGTPVPERAQTRRERVEPEPSVVRISIGRIDVRTAPPAPKPAPAPRPGPAAPRLGLDDYLRNGGRG